MRRAFLIGSNGPGYIQKLKYAEKDAERMQACLASGKCGFFTNDAMPYNDIYEILSRIDQFFAATKDEDTLVFYFSGHAAVQCGDLHLLFHFSEKENLPSTSLPTVILRHRLKFCRARNKLIILDCCHAGAIYDACGIKGNNNRGDVPDLNLASESHIAFCAGSRFERAREDPNLKAGILTHFIIDAIENNQHKADVDRDGFISAQDLNEWIRKQIELKNKRRCKETQFPLPLLQGEQKGKFY